MRSLILYYYVIASYSFILPHLLLIADSVTSLALSSVVIAFNILLPVFIATLCHHIKSSSAVHTEHKYKYLLCATRAFSRAVELEPKPPESAKSPLQNSWRRKIFTTFLFSKQARVNSSAVEIAESGAEVDLESQYALAMNGTCPV